MTHVKQRHRAYILQFLTAAAMGGEEAQTFIWLQPQGNVTKSIKTSL